MRKFFVDSEFHTGQKIILSNREYAEEIKHMVKVLRLEAGSLIGLLNGRGFFAEAKLLEIKRDSAELEILSVSERKPAVRLHLLQATLKGPKMDWLVEKMTELNVYRLQPVLTEFTVAADAGSERSERWQRIAQAAIKQSGSGILPTIAAPLDLRAALASLPAQTTKIFLHLAEGKAPLLREALGQIKTSPDLALLIGPEGGLSAAEADLLLAEGWRMASLGNTILRGETAGIVAAAIALHFVDFSPA